MENSRRSFLKMTLIGGGSAAALTAGVCGAKIGCDYRRASSQEPRPVFPEKIENLITFHGEVFPDNPNRMFREGRLGGSPEPEREVDVLIVGGGAAGLTAAYRLKDRDFLLLEALPELGGNSMYGEWEGVPFSLGAQYIGGEGTWSDPVWELCRELGLSPVKDVSPLIVVFPGDLRVADPYSVTGFIRMPLPLAVKRDIARFYLIDMPGIEVEARKEELDQIPFSEFIKSYSYSPEFMEWFELVAKSYPRTGDVSAYYAVSAAQDVEYAKGDGTYSFAGGLGLITRTLAARVEAAGPGRMKTSAFVYDLRHEGEGRVVARYILNGKPSAVRARSAIVNAEGNIAKDIVVDLPAPQIEAMSRMRRYGYPMFHFCFGKPVYQGGYRVGVMDCPAMQAMTVPDWFSRERGMRRPNIISCFNKLRFEDGDLVHDKDRVVKMACQMLSELDLRFPGAIEALEAVHVFLRTGNYCVPQPGYITEVLPRLGQSFGNIHFANAEFLKPVTLFPEAVVAGTRAAKKV